MKKQLFCFLFVAATAVGMICFAGCSHKNDAIAFFKNDPTDFETVIEFLNANENVLEITTERPSILSNVRYLKSGGLYIILGDDETIDPDEYSESFKKIRDYTVRVIPEHSDKGLIVVFQTESKLAGGKYMIYTESGEESEDEYIILDEWISDHWYIAHS